MRKLLIANRGEIACRIIRSAKGRGIQTVAVYSEADKDALHVEMADEAHLIGAPPAAQSYLQAARILDAARATGADAIHPGYGFLAENADFAEAVISAGLVWVGPAPETIRLMGDKQNARETALRAGVPVVPGSRRFAAGALDRLAGAADAALADPTLAAKLMEQGIIPRRLAPEAFRAFVREETQKFAAIIRDARITPEG